MPLYSFKCRSCEKESELQLPMEKSSSKPKCECGKRMTRMLSNTGKDDFVPGMFDNIEHDPVYIGSRKELKDVLRRNGQQMHGFYGCSNGSELRSEY